jgi:hypothetical protein
MPATGASETRRQLIPFQGGLACEACFPSGDTFEASPVRATGSAAGPMPASLVGPTYSGATGLLPGLDTLREAAIRELSILLRPSRLSCRKSVAQHSAFNGGRQTCDTSSNQNR